MLLGDKCVEPFFFSCGGVGLGRGYRVIADSVSISILLLKLLIWKILDLDFTWSVGGDTVKQRKWGLEL